MSKPSNAIAIARDLDGKVVTVTVSGRLGHESYEFLNPKIDEIVASEGKFRLVLDLAEFEGWTPRGAWDDLKFGLKRAGDVERVAVVGDHAWATAVAAMARPLTPAEVRHFSRRDLDAAQRWAREGLPPQKSVGMADP